MYNNSWKAVPPIFAKTLLFTCRNNCYYIILRYLLGYESDFKVMGYLIHEMEKEHS